jgi:hypothetical protein
MNRDDHRSAPKPAAAHARRDVELRLHGVNACLAAFAHRPQDLRKVWLTESNIPAFKRALAWCVRQRIGYRVVEADEIEKLTASSHHEGVCFALLRSESPLLDTALAALDPNAPALLLWQPAQSRGDPAQRCAFWRACGAAGGCDRPFCCCIPCFRGRRGSGAMRSHGQCRRRPGAPASCRIQARCNHRAWW